MNKIVNVHFEDIDLERAYIIPNIKGLMVCFLVSQNDYFLLDDSGGKHAVNNYLILKDLHQELGGIPDFQGVGIIANKDYYRVYLVINSKEINVSKQGTVISESIDELFEDAILRNASDIHFIRNNQLAIINVRVNGLLSHLKTISSSDCDKMMFVAYNILATTKESTWNINIPQDANITREFSFGQYRFRYAHMPIFGDSGGCYHAVMRIIKVEINKEIIDDTDEIAVCPLSKLKLRDDERSDLEFMLQAPHGLLLITGVTGSGKSTTIKNILEWMYDEKYCGQANFVTIEDPVEYKIKGAIQTSVVRIKGQGNPFLPALKSAMRRDPDVLMIGETRDEDTTTALTGAIESGHYAVTTVHAGSVTTALQRLESLGVKRDRLASPGFLAGIITQSLAPILCEHCKVLVSDNNLKYRVFSKNPTGCIKCNNVGTSGRRAVVEMLVPDLNILEEIAGANPAKVYRYWRNRHSDKNKINQGYLMKEKVYMLVMEGVVDYRWFNSFYGSIDKDIEKELYEKIFN